MEKPKYSISPEAIANGINDLLDEKEELQERINTAIEMIYKMTENELNYIHWKGKEVLVCGSDFEGAEILLDILKGE
jgi:hypothetical protein